MTTTSPPQLLGDDGDASIATAIMMSHHGFRRDLARFALALPRLADGANAAGAALPLQEAWIAFRNILHGHHEAEDQRLFPSLLVQAATLAPVIEGLTSDHRRIDPLLAHGDEAFGALSAATTEAAAKVIAELTRLLDPHLALEESDLVPHMRAWKEFPPPPNEAELDLIAQGFAWACDGIAPDVLDRVFAMLPSALTAKLPAARAAYETRRSRAWGTAQPGSSRSPVPAGP